MSNKEKHPKSFHKIRFQDCDPYNHLNNARYADYFINAREDHLEDFYQMKLSDHVAKTGKGWFTISSHNAFYKPALVQEVVCIESQLFEFDERLLAVEMKMWDQKQSHVKALFWIKFMYYDLIEKRVTAHEDFLMDLFEGIISPISENVFEARSNAILQMNKAKK
ncbi:MAG TPA: acyl-CoA thioesterase [Saprospiraceae bacterium]|nr:acyl-CoA thioesterase [Saprospiraceae bacterium]